MQSMNHNSNEVKQLMARASVVVGRDVTVGGPANDVLRALLPALVNGTKEKNTYVRANSELALRAVLRLPKDEVHAQVRTVLFYVRFNGVVAVSIDVLMFITRRH